MNLKMNVHVLTKTLDNTTYSLNNVSYLVLQTIKISLNYRPNYKPY